MNKKIAMALIFGTLIGFGVFQVFPPALMTSQPVLAVEEEPPADDNQTGGGGTENAQVKDAVCSQLDKLDQKNCDDDNSTILNNIVKPIIQTLVLVIGGVAVLIIVVGGFMYILSAGDANNTKRAKDTILYAVIGLVIALFAQAIISFVIGAFA